MKLAFIHNDKKLGTGAHYINELMAIKLRGRGVEVKNFYPRTSLIDPPIHLKGFSNILFFYSLLEKKDEIIAHLEENPPATQKEAQAKIKELTGIQRSLPQVREFLKKTGYDAAR